MKKKYIIILFSIIVVISSCSIFHKSEKKNNEKPNTEVNKSNTSSTKTPKQRQEDFKKEQKRLAKESEKRKKEKEKADKAKQKEQDALIKNAQKAERKKIEDERKAEKALLKYREDSIQNIEKQKTKQSKNSEDNIFKKAFNFIFKGGGNSTTDNDKQNSQDVLKTIVYGEDSTQSDSTITMLSDKEKKQILENSKKQDKEKGNIIKRTFRKVFPKKVERDIAYSNIYKEKPKTILIMYPWNRSKEDKASDMLYIATFQELSMKGYYVIPLVPTLDMYRKDTTLNSHYITPTQIKEYKNEYGVDAVLFVTIYRFEKPWWTTNVNAVADYTLISTTTNDTLFERKADFNYDTPIPASNSKNKDLINDTKEVQYLGIMEQMQKYVFIDMPIGPRHIDYNTDQKKFSHKREMKYKIDVKPS